MKIDLKEKINIQESFNDLWEMYVKAYKEMINSPTYKKSSENIKKELIKKLKERR